MISKIKYMFLFLSSELTHGVISCDPLTTELTK